MFFDKINTKENTIALGVIGLYVLWIALVVGFRADHFQFLGLVLAAYLLHATSRKVLYALLFFIAYWVIYDSLRLYPNYMFNEVSIQEIYELEKIWFGIEEGGQIITPNEWWKTRTTPVMDFITGVFYLSWIPVPLGFAFWLFFKDRKLMLQFIFVFFLLNAIGLIIYYIYPAAPPWYVELHGFEKNFNIPGNEARLASFDKLIGINIFNGIYDKNANVFAAVPSIHSAIPVSAFYFALKKRLKGATLLFLISMLGIWFSAIYSNHHYIIDVILGIFCAVFAIIIYELLMKTAWMKRFFENYLKLVS